MAEDEAVLFDNSRVSLPCDVDIDFREARNPMQIIKIQRGIVATNFGWSATNFGVTPMLKRLTLIAIVGVIVLTAQSAQAQNLLTNGELEPDPLAGWDMVNTVTGMPGAEVSSGSLVGFANHPSAIEGQVGYWLRGFAGHSGPYAMQNKMTNTSLIQTVSGVAGQTYTLTGWSKFEGNFSGSVDTLDSGSPSGAVPSPTDTTFLLEFLNSGGGVLGSPVTLDVKANRVAQSPIGFAGDAEWYQHTLMGLAPVGTANVRVTASATDMVFNIDPQQSGFYDDFSLRASGAPATELLINGNLNTGSVVSGWTVTNFPGAFTGNFQTADFANHTPGGTTGLWMKPFGTVEPVGEVLISQIVPATAGDYTLSGYSKWEVNFKSAAPETEVILQLEYLDSSEAVIGTDVVDIKDEGQMADNMWRQFTLEGTAPAGTMEIRVTAGASGMDANEEMTSNQSAFWDDLVLESAAAGQPGDHNGDGVVDAADYVAWRKNPTAFGGDPGGYNTWRENFGEPAAGSGGAVPEPACCTLAIIALVGAAATRRRRTATQK
jgi:hypothetical protein